MGVDILRGDLSDVAPDLPKTASEKLLKSIYKTEEVCRTFLETLRWPDGAQCPRCKSKRAFSCSSRPQFDCAACGFRFSLTTGTPMHGTRLPLRTWCLALYLILESRRGISANKLSQKLGLGYKTAWHLYRRIRSAFGECDSGFDGKGQRPPVSSSLIGREDAVLLLLRYGINPYHPESSKYLDGYLDEIAWRFNNRSNPDRFKDGLRKLVAT
jgi:transposase-like protein